MTYQAQVQMAGLPITLVLISTGEVLMVPAVRLKGVFDPSPGLDVWIFADAVTIRNTVTGEEDEYYWNTAYTISEHFLLRKWLKTLNLQPPH